MPTRPTRRTQRARAKDRFKPTKSPIEISDLRAQRLNREREAQERTDTFFERKARDNILAGYAEGSWDRWVVEMGFVVGGYRRALVGAFDLVVGVFVLVVVIMIMCVWFGVGS